MKFLVQLLVCFLLNFSFLQAQTFPAEVQKMLSKAKSIHNSAKSVQNRGNALPCIPDSILNFTYASATDSTLIGYYLITENTNDNSVNSKNYVVGTVPNQFILSTYNRQVYNNQNNKIKNEEIFYDAVGLEAAGTKKEYFLSPSTQKNDSTIQYNRVLNNNSWVKLFKNINTYNSNGQLSEIRDYSWDGNNWLSFNKQVIIYGINNKISSSNFLKLNNSSWIIERSMIYTYDNNDSLTQILSIILPSGDNLSKDVYTYTGARTKIEGFNWNSNSQSWISYGYNAIDKDANGRDTRFEYFFLNGTQQDKFIFNYYYGATNEDCISLVSTKQYVNNNLFKTEKYYYIYGTNVATQTPLNEEKWSINPNPNDGNFEINAPVGATYTITDAIGRVLLNQKCFEPKNLVNISQYPAGFYLVLVNNGGRYEVKKMVKE
jgi:hypothetical protein